MAAVGYYWNQTSSAFQRATIDNADGGLNVHIIGGGSGGGAMTVADGANVVEGATTDAAVTTDTTGTLSGKLRGLVKWAYERMPASLGQKTMAASLPVVLASDQSSVPVASTLTAETTKVIGTVNVSAGQTVGLAAGTQTVGKADQGAAGAAAWPVSLATAPTTPVTGVFWQATQPVSLASQPLPTGATLELGGQLQIVAELLTQLLIETRIHSLQFQQGLNVADDPAVLRSDPAYLN